MFGYRPAPAYWGASTNSGRGGIWLLVAVLFLAAPHLADAAPTDKASGRGKSKAAAPTKVPRGLTFTTGAGCSPRGDWRRVDPRVRTILAGAAKHYAIRVSCLRTGHSTYVKGSRRVSNHTVWRAVDIDRVDGRAVRSWNQEAHHLALAFGKGQMGAQPSEVGSPWSFGRRPWFTDSGHKNHLHVGFRSR